MSEVSEDLTGTVRQAWQEALGVDGIALDDDFFDLGGDSMVAARLAALLEGRLGVEVPLLTVFDHPTVAELTAELEKARGQRN